MAAPRLTEFDYKGNIPYSVTICTNNLKRIFVDDTTVKHCIEILKDVSEKYSFDLYCYTFMPDHVHLCIVGKKDNSSFVKMINMCKQKTGYWYKQKNKLSLWQKSYYDHVIRKEEGLINVVKYILNNPVRKNLVCNYTDYPYSGSLMLDIRDL